METPVQIELPFMSLGEMMRQASDHSEGPVMNQTWIGKYVYDETPTANLSAAPPISFEVHLHKGFLGRITGTIKDGPGGSSGEGTIKGWIRRGTIRFVKQMPILTLTGPDGLETWREFIWRLYQLEVSERPHFPVYYEGIIEHGDAKGEWRIEPTEILIPGKNLVMRFPNQFTGSWTMRSI